MQKSFRRRLRVRRSKYPSLDEPVSALKTGMTRQGVGLLDDDGFIILCSEIGYYVVPSSATSKVGLWTHMKDNPTEGPRLGDETPTDFSRDASQLSALDNDESSFAGRRETSMLSGRSMTWEPSASMVAEDKRLPPGERCLTIPDSFTDEALLDFASYAAIPCTTSADEIHAAHQTQLQAQCQASASAAGSAKVKAPMVTKPLDVSFLYQPEIDFLVALTQTSVPNGEASSSEDDAHEDSDAEDQFPEQRRLMRTQLRREKDYILTPRLVNLMVLSDFLQCEDLNTLLAAWSARLLDGCRTHGEMASMLGLLDGECGPQALTDRHRDMIAAEKEWFSA